MRNENRPRKSFLYYFFCCFLCSPQIEEPDLSNPDNLPLPKKIDIITHKANLKLEVSQQKPQTPDIAKFPYICPICFQYYNKIYKAICCGNYVCPICVAIMNQKLAVEENNKANCIFCNTEKMIVTDVEANEAIKRYTDSPYIEKLFQNPKKMSSHFNNPKTNSNLTHINQNLFFSPKHSLNEIIEKNRLNRLEEEKFIEKNEKLKFPQVSSYITRMNFNYDQARSDGFKGFKMVLKPVRRSFEELVLKKTELAPNNQEVEDLKKFKDEIDNTGKQMSLKLTPTSKIQDFEFYPLIKIQNNHDLNIRSKKKIEETRVKSNDFFCSDDGNSYQEISLGEKVVQNNYDWKKQLKETFQQIEFSLYSKMKAQNKRSMNLKLYEKFLEFFCYFKPRHSISLNNISINLNLKSLTPLTPNMTHTQTAENNIVDALISRHINFLSSQSHIFQSSRNWVKSMIYIISDFLQAILSLVSCVLYILSTYIDDSTDHTFVNFIHISDYVITALFTLDLMRHFFECKHKLKFFLKGHSIIDIMAILPIYLQLIFNVQQSALGFLHILQIFRIIRILRLYRLFKEYDVEGSDKIDNSLNEARFSLQKQMAVLICTFFALLFISAGISYELNGIFDDKTYLVTRYDQGTGQIQLFYDMYTFFYAFYLMFQTFFSVGYGDVVACASSSRILICILVLLFLCIAIDQLLKLHEIKSKTSLWEYDFKKHDHTIIVGFFNENSLLRILQELFKNDCENKIKHILLVRNIPPSIEFINLMDSAIYEGRISYLQNSLLSETMPIKSNMRKCRNVFLVNECPSTFSYQQDKMLTALMHSIQECFPFITKVLRISHPEIAKSFYGNLNHWTPWNKVFSTLDLKSHLMVENIFNKGFSTIFSNLFSANRLLSMEKDLPNINWYMEYGASLLQELYCVKFSTFFLGMKFQTVMQILSKSRSRLRAEGLVLIGVKTKYSSEEYDSRTSLLINPQNYCIRLDDYGIVLATNLERAEFLSYFDLEAHEIHLKTLPIEDPQLEIKTQEIYKAFEDARITNDHFTMRKSLSEHILLWKEDISEKISGHIILFYAENIFENVIPLLRAKTKKPIFYYTESKPDDRWFRLASKTSNIFFVQGDIFDLTHLRNSGIQKTYHVCIFNSLPLSMVESNTPECLLLANLIDDYFNVPYTIEINDNNEIRFLANKPKKYIANLGFHFYPKYIAGDLYVLNILDSLISYSANNSNILDVFIHMFVYNENHQQQKYKDEECEIQNQNIHITENLQIKTIKCPGIYNNKKYSDLLFDFCCLKPSIIPIGLITDRYTTSKKDRSPIMKKKNHNISVNYFNVLDVEMDQNFLPSQLTLTNPLPTTILSENDRIIIIGNNQIESEDLNNLLMKKDVETIGEENSGKSNESLIMEHLQESDNDLNNKKLLELMDLTLSGKKKITKKIEEKNNMIKNLIEEIERKKHGYEKFLEWDKEK